MNPNRRCDACNGEGGGTIWPANGDVQFARDWICGACNGTGVTGFMARPDVLVELAGARRAMRRDWFVRSHYAMTRQRAMRPVRLPGVA